MFTQASCVLFLCQQISRLCGGVNANTGNQEPLLLLMYLNLPTVALTFLLSQWMELPIGEDVFDNWFTLQGSPTKTRLVIWFEVGYEEIFGGKGRANLSWSANPEWNLTEYFETIGKTNNVLKAVEEKERWKQVKNETLHKKAILRQFEYVCHL